MPFKGRRLVILLLVSAFAACIYAEQPQARFYVSAAGNDSWSGTLAAANTQGSDGPFATLEAARDAVRSCKQTGRMPAGGAVVFVRGGVYVGTKTFVLDAGDSGDAGSPVIYKAYEKEEVRFVGGRAISGFEPVRDKDVLERMDESCRDKILQMNLRGLGIEDYGQFQPRGFGRKMYPAVLELFFDDKPMQLARWPNEGWSQIADVPKDKNDRFVYQGDRPQRWERADQIWVHGYWKQDWADSYEKVQAIDARNKWIITQPPHGVYGYTKGQRYYTLNILEELDQPGEWYLERKTGVLYFWPPTPLAGKHAFVSILEEPLVSMRDVSYVRMEGFIFECTRGTGVELRGGSSNTIADCVLRNIGNVAANIDGGTNNAVTGCEIYNTGDGGIILRGGDRKMLTPAGNYACNNDIHHYSRWVRTYRPAVSVGGVGNRVCHCLIHDAPHVGILFGGNDHTLEYNEVHNVCYETGDVGAFYTGRDWTTRGTVIRHNYFHDIHGPYTHGAMAVYLDDAASGTTIYGNIFCKASRAAFIGGGRDNIVENNIFVDCQPAVHIDARGLGWAKKYIAKDGEWRMYEKLRDVNYDKPPYSVRYPQLASILEEDPAVPEGNVVRRNICVGGRWMDLQAVDAKLVAIEGNLIDGDPHFVDKDKGDFRLKDDSPAHKLGFKAIPVADIGLMKK